MISFLGQFSLQNMSTPSIANRLFFDILRLILSDIMEKAFSHNHEKTKYRGEGRSYVSVPETRNTLGPTKGRESHQVATREGTKKTENVALKVGHASIILQIVYYKSYNLPLPVKTLETMISKLRKRRTQKRSEKFLSLLGII